MTTQDVPTLFKTKVNLVFVPVVVRDAKGKTIGTFTKDDFQLYDKGKLQAISKFSVEQAGSQNAKAAQTADAIPGDPGTAPPDIPERFVAFLFDDVHLNASELIRSRDAAIKQIGELKPTERAAIFTTSGQDQLDFTGDQEKLREDLLRLRMRPMTEGSFGLGCPIITDYMAHMIVRNDAMTLTTAANEAVACNVAKDVDDGRRYVQPLAARIDSAATHQSHVTLLSLVNVVRRMSAMPGQRVIVMVSPGFYAPDAQDERNEAIDRAVRANVTINSLDARGLWVDPIADASVTDRSINGDYRIMKQSMDRMSASAQSDILAEVAQGTGGKFFENNNDLKGGLQLITASPEFHYILGFSPQNLKLDGAYHSLKVSLKATAGKGLDIQGRKGYFAPKKLSSAAENEKEEIEEALFSRDEMSELPVELHTQFFKIGDKQASIAVLCRLDAGRLTFRKEDGRNNNKLTIVAALFDRDGNFKSAIQKTVDMKLKDETLTRFRTQGVSVKTSFSVEPGTYMVRLVVRDSEGQNMSALNGAVAIQ